jgi:hypothetical protein
VRVDGSRERLTAAQPTHVARYGSALVFLMAGSAEMESGGTWITGSADFVIARDDRQPLRLDVRNVPVDNHVTIEADGWRQDLAMRPGEARTLDAPFASDRSAIRLRVSAERGARPIDFDKGSADTRLLGVWVEIR